MDIELPNGTVIEGIPEGTSKQDIMAKAISAGLATAADFGQPTGEMQRGRPTMSNDPRIIKDTESRPSNENFLDKAGRFLSTPAGIVTPEQLGGSATGRAVQGVLDPLLGIGQLTSKALGNDTVSQRMQQNELRYQQARKDSGAEGIDLARLAGNVASPVNYVVPTAGVGSLARSAATGASLAATQPVYGIDYWAEKGIQASVGAVLGPLAEYGVKFSGKALDKMKGLTESGQMQYLQDLLNKTVGTERDNVVKALSTVKPIVPGSRPTAAEALADIPEAAGIAALQKQVAGEGTSGTMMLRREAENEAARQAQLAGIAGTEAERTALSTARGELFGKYAQPALDANDTVRAAYQNIEKASMGKLSQLIGSAEELQAGQAASQAAIMKGSGVVPALTPVKETLTAAAQQRTTQLKAYQRESLAENGLFPLEVNSLVSKLNSALRGTRSDEAKKVIEGVKSDLLQKADNNGFLSSVDLYENVRKVMNQNINRYLNQGQQPFQGGIPQQAAAAGDNVKKLIDAELNKSSNGLWGKYIEEYATHSRKLDRMAVGEALQQKLQGSLGNVERAGAFAQAVQEAGSTIKKATGQPRYEKMSQVLTADETAAVNRVLADVQRQQKGVTLSNQLKAPDMSLSSPVESVGLLNRAYTLTKEVLGYITRGNAEKARESFAKLSLEPQGMAVFMQAGPITAQRKFVAALNKVLTPEQQQILIQATTVQGPARTAGE